MIKYKPDFPKWLPYSIFGIFTLGVFLQILILGALTRKINTEKITSVTNPETGTTEFAEFVASNKTTPAAVTRFLFQWKLATYSANGKNPDGTPDRGAYIAGQVVSTPFAMGMEFVEQPFMDNHVVARSKALIKYPQQQLLASGALNSKVDPGIDIIGVTEISPGVWSAEVISTQTYSSRKTGEGEAFINREKLELKVILPSVKTWSKDKASYSSVYKELEKQRLRITNITALPI